MLRFQSALASGLGALLVVPVLVGQGDVASLQDALAGTRRALEVLRGLEQRLGDDPAATLGLVLSATEPPRGEEQERERALERLRNEVGLLQMELDAMQSPVLAPDGSVQGALGTSVPLASLAGIDSPRSPRSPDDAGVTTGLDDDLRALLGGAPAPRANRAAQPAGGDAAGARIDAESSGEPAYSADPLRHGIACYRAGRYAEARELLAPLSGATALYWQARTLERLERLDEAVERMERALEGVRAGGGQGEHGEHGELGAERVEADLEFLRWKRDFVKNLPAKRPARDGGKR